MSSNPDGFDQFITSFQVLEPALAQLDPYEARLIHEPRSVQVEVKALLLKFLWSDRSGKAVHRLLDGMRALVSAFEPEEFDAFAHFIMRNVACGHLKAQARLDNRYSLLMKLIGRAHARFPLSPLLALCETEYEVFNAAMLDANGPMAGVLELETGERRATQLKLALLTVLETTYEPYLVAVIILARLVDGELRIPTNRNLGVLVRDAITALDRIGGDAEYPGLVDPDAAWIRNATAHRASRQWQYQPNGDRILVQASKGLPREFAVPELIDRTRALHQISGATFWAASQLFLMREYMVGGGIMGRVLSSSRLALLGDEQGALRAAEDADLLVQLLGEQLAAELVAGGARGRDA